jgi:protein-tyrosine-phosphatase
MAEARQPQAVLFACRMNAIRSPMAGALARLYFPKLYIATTGILAGENDPFAATVMDEVGLDIAKHRPSTFDDLEDSNFDLIVTLSPDAHHKALEFTRSLATEVEYWPTPDPAAADGSREQVLNAYREVRDMLTERIRQRFGWTETPGG